jgi:hypothetical protein
VGYAREDRVTKIGTKKNPAVVRVQTEERAYEVLDYCTERGIQVLIGLEADKDEDLTDIARVPPSQRPPCAPPSRRSAGMTPARAARASSTRSAVSTGPRQRAEKGETRVRRHLQQILLRRIGWCPL